MLFASFQICTNATIVAAGATIANKYFIMLMMYVPTTGSKAKLPAATINEPPTTDLLHETIEPMVQRELQHRGIVADSSYDLKLIGWIEVV